MARVPYDYGAVKGHTEPVHPVRVALLPLEDDRPDDERSEDDRFVYRGREYRGTSWPFDVTEIVARHLAKTRVFAQVILVRDVDQARREGADLFLSGAVYRLRGYIEARSSPEGSGRSNEVRHVLAEVFFKNLRLDVPTGEAVMLSDAGWSIAEERPLGIDGSEPDPWRILAEAMQIALTRWTDAIAEADLSGGFIVKEHVQLVAGTATVSVEHPFGGLAEHSPEGWRFVETSSIARPAGWRGAARCRAAYFGLAQTMRFHRMLGPYQPRVKLWVCPDDTLLSYNGRVDFPARLLGRTAGRWYFSLALGQSNWPHAEEQIAKYLHLERAPKYRFRVGEP